jgi:hypothetical protein
MTILLAQVALFLLVVFAPVVPAAAINETLTGGTVQVHRGGDSSRSMGMFKRPADTTFHLPFLGALSRLRLVKPHSSLPNPSMMGPASA